ncbi:hypothetical protein Tco_0058551 [Tanacetum coccineum]
MYVGQLMKFPKTPTFKTFRERGGSVTKPFSCSNGQNVEPSEKKDGTRINDWECPKCGNGDFSFRLQNQPRVPVSLLDIAWTLYYVPSIFSVCIDLDRDSNDIRTMAEMSKAVLQAADKGKMMVLQPEIITLQDIRPTHTRKTPRINAETGGYSCSVVIPVSSTWVTTRYEGLQLTATPATHYYLNPEITEVPSHPHPYTQISLIQLMHSTSKDNLPTQMKKTNDEQILHTLDIQRQPANTEQSLMTIPPCQPSHASAAARKELFLDTDATEKKPRQEP